MTRSENKVFGGLSVPQSSKRRTKRSDAAYKFRYEITGTSGDAPIGVGMVIVETQWMGRGHTWTILNRSTGEFVGSFTGKYLGRRNQSSSQDSSQ